MSLLLENNESSRKHSHGLESSAWSVMSTVRPLSRCGRASGGNSMSEGRPTTRHPPRFDARWWNSLVGIVSNEKENVLVN